MFANEDVPIINGCSCGSKLFLFVKHKRDVKLAEKYRPQIEEKIEEIDKERKSGGSGAAGLRGSTSKQRADFGVETIKVHDIGVYSIHLEALMQGAPIIVLSKGGSYIISFPSLFEEKELELPLK